jgi:hypothetical protein
MNWDERRGRDFIIGVETNAVIRLSEFLLVAASLCLLIIDLLVTLQCGMLTVEAWWSQELAF